MKFFFRIKISIEKKLFRVEVILKSLGILVKGIRRDIYYKI